MSLVLAALGPRHAVLVSDGREMSCFPFGLKFKQSDSETKITVLKTGALLLASTGLNRACHRIRTEAEQFTASFKGDPRLLFQRLKEHLDTVVRTAHRSEQILGARTESDGSTLLAGWCGLSSLIRGCVWGFQNDYQCIELPKPTCLGIGQPFDHEIFRQALATERPVIKALQSVIRRVSQTNRCVGGKVFVHEIARPVN
jgi:hypothetical protein